MFPVSRAQRRAYLTEGRIHGDDVQVNVVRGLKMYEDIFTGVELSKLNDFVNELRLAGREGELSGDSWCPQICTLRTTFLSHVV